MFNINIL